MLNGEPTRCSNKRNGILNAYAVLTNKGLFRYYLYKSNRSYNEDRVSMVLNIIKPQDRIEEVWPKCSFFGIYDGHAGSFAANFLRDNLHTYVISEPTFPSKPIEAIFSGFNNAEKRILHIQSQNAKTANYDKSGSCAITILIIDDMCYVGNVGDSRAIIAM